MDEAFVYEWEELIKERKPMPIHVFEALLLTVIAGFGTSIHGFISGDGTAIYQLIFTIIIIAAVFGFSLWKHKKRPDAEVTISSLMVDGDVIIMSRHVVSDTGRRYFTVWHCLGVEEINVEMGQHVIQVCGKWNISAYRVRGKKVGDFIDSEIRTIPQTFRFTDDKFHEALKHIRIGFPNMVTSMTKEEYEEAKPFLHKHYNMQ